MHSLDVIIVRNVRAAGRECAEAAQQNDLDRTTAILAVHDQDVREIAGTLAEKPGDFCRVVDTLNVQFGRAVRDAEA